MKLNYARVIVWWFAMLAFLGLFMSLFGIYSTSSAQIPQPTPTPLPLLPTPTHKEEIPSTDQSLPNRHTVMVGSTDGWVETPLILQAGDKFTVSYVSGLWSVDYNLLNYVGPEGYSPEVDAQIFPGCKIVSSLPYGRLLGEVGSGSTISVGSGGTFTADASGYLFLRINDMDSCLVDNDGSVVMEVNLVTDTTLPTVNWIAPVGNQEVYYTSSGIVNLEVSATDDTSVALVDFWRWDAVNGNWVYLGEDNTPPYQATVDVSTLNMEWNQINAYAYDHANNWSTENIWLYRGLPISANFDAWPQSGNAPLTVSFHIVSTENITSCLWDYGDGTTGTSCEAYHDHIYNNAGSYTVSLTVSGSGASDSMTRQNYITVSGVPDLRQNGEIVVSGDLHEGGTVYLTIPVKNFGSAASPAIHVYTEGLTANGSFWRAENSQPPSVFLVPGQAVEFTVQHELWDGDVGWWDISDGVHIWNDDTSSYYGPLDANGYEQKTVDFYVDPATPDAPTNAQASDGTYTDKVFITWNSSSGATSYQVYRCTSSSTSSCGSVIGSPSSTSYNDTGATPGVTYYYRVKACNSSGCSGFSSHNTGWRAPACYILTRTHTGTGNNPTASPTSSSGCNSGYYHAGESITMTAHPASGHHLDHWSGTDSSSSNHLTMPANAHTVTAHYAQDAPTLTVAFSDETYTVDEGAGTIEINVNLSGTSGQTVLVDYATSNGTATSGSDYLATGGQLTFAPNQTSKTFTVPILEDTLNEPNETVNLTLNNPVNALLGSPRDATLTIVDNDTGSLQLGFLPNPNGYQFRNKQLWRTWNMFEQFYGSDNVNCQTAKDYFKQTYEKVANGWSCVGFSMTSLLSYLNWSQPNAGSFAMPHFDSLYDHTQSAQLTNPIAYYSGVQLSREYLNEYSAWLTTCGQDPNEMVEQIKRGIQNQEPVVVSLKAASIGYHALVPYGVVEVSSTQTDVYVYDSEAPGQERTIRFQRSGNGWQWQYTFVGSLAGAGTRTGGCKDMYFFTLRTSLNQGIPLVNFCQAPSITTMGLNPETTVSTGRMLMHVPAEGDWVARDNSGNYLGWIDGQLVSQITNAYAIPQSLGDASISYRELYLPAATYALEVRNNPVQAFDYAFFGDGRMIGMYGELQSTDSSFETQATSDLEQASIVGIQRLNSFALNFINEQSTLSRETTIAGDTVSGSANLDSHFDGEKVILSRASGSLHYNLRLDQIGGQDGIFISEPLILGANEAHTLRPENWWNLDSTNVILEIDRGRDGTIDETRTLENYASSHVYLPLIHR